MCRQVYLFCLNSRILRGISRVFSLPRIGDEGFQTFRSGQFEYLPEARFDRFHFGGVRRADPGAQPLFGHSANLIRHGDRGAFIAANRYQQGWRGPGRTRKRNHDHGSPRRGIDPGLDPIDPQF